MFIGVKMDEESTEAIHQWLKRCAVQNKPMPLNAPLPKRFIYIPICYSGSNDLDEPELRSHLASSINVSIELQNPRIMPLGGTGNVSLVFESDYLKERYRFWTSKDRRFRQRSDGEWPKFKARIPMSHFCRLCNDLWLKDLPIREIRLVEEFAVEFDRKTFLTEVKKEMGWR